MNIVKPGRDPASDVIPFTCKKCGCEYEANKMTETRTVMDRNEHVTVSTCPMTFCRTDNYKS